MIVNAKLTSQSFVDLFRYLEKHEKDIGNSVHDFGELKGVFIQLFDRAPRQDNDTRGKNNV